MMKRVSFELGPIPPATSAEVEIPEFLVRGADHGDRIDCRHMRIVYRCLDCGWQTEDRTRMLDHQAHQGKYHSGWQRLRRQLRSLWSWLSAPVRM